MENILNNLNFQPTSLTIEELQNPEDLVISFFDNYPLHQTREALWELDKGWIQHAADYGDVEQTRDMLSFYTEMITFVNATYITSELKKGNRIT